MSERAGLVLVELAQQYGRRRYQLYGPVSEYTNKELLERCEYTPEFGGDVQRGVGGDEAIVQVYTD